MIHGQYVHYFYSLERLAVGLFMPHFSGLGGGAGDCCSKERKEAVRREGLLKRSWPSFIEKCHEILDLLFFQ
jgi:hypothetical protein